MSDLGWIPGRVPAGTRRRLDNAMAANAKPAAGSGGHRKIIIRDWKSHQKHTLQGFFTATFPSGLVLHDLMLHQKNGVRWIAFPAREWKDSQGNRQFARFVEFSDRGAADRFRDAVLEALDRHLGSLP
jgi:hypothetical protein